MIWPPPPVKIHWRIFVSSLLRRVPAQQGWRGPAGPSSSYQLCLCSNCRAKQFSSPSSKPPPHPTVFFFCVNFLPFWWSQSALSYDLMSARRSWVLLGEICARRLEGGRGRKGWSSLPKELGSINSAPAVLRNRTLMVAELKEDNVLFLSSYRETGRELLWVWCITWRNFTFFFFLLAKTKIKRNVLLQSPKHACVYPAKYHPGARRWYIEIKYAIHGV